MAEGGRPSVYVVDSCATRPPLPPRLSRGQRRGGAAQTLLFLLVGVALCGLVIEACFLYRLYKPESANSGSTSKHREDEDVTHQRPGGEILPSKPAAHLTDGLDVSHGKHIMDWSRNADPLLYEMGYENRSLIIQKTGYYYVYSKVSFLESKVFYHSVQVKTKMYIGESIPLLASRTHSESSRKRSNSYLGGVFLLYKDDALFVNVSDTAKILRHKSYENIFGAYMI